MLTSCVNEPQNLKHAGQGHAPKSMLLQWHITNRCDGSCLHCYQDNRDNRTGTEFASLGAILEQFLNLLDDFDKRNSPDKTKAHVTITGGEPFLHGDVLDLIDLLSAHKKRFSYAILTNGVMIDDRLARFLAVSRPRFVQVSIDGAMNIHDSIRGTGNFESVCAGVRRLVKNGVPTMISFTANSANYLDFPQVVHEGKKLGVDLVWADRFVPLGQSEALQRLVLTPYQTEEFVRLVSNEAARSSGLFRRRFRVSSGRALQFIHGGGTPYFCKAGRSLLTVLPNGDLVPCRRMPIPAGNLLTDNLADLYWNNENLRSLRRRDIRVAGCEKCAHAANCRGGLRCLSYAVSGDYFLADPGCWIASGVRS